MARRCDRRRPARRAERPRDGGRRPAHDGPVDAAPAPVFVARGLTKIYQMGEVTVEALRGVDFDSVAGRVRRAARPVGHRQVDAAEHPRRARRADLRRGDLPATTNLTTADEAALTDVPPHARRLRLPVLQPDSEPHGARERRARHRDRRAADDAGGGARARRPRPAPRSLPGAALRRRAAARGHRARHRQAARRAALRRADRRARHHHRHRRARGARARQPRARHRHRRHHPQRRDRRHGRPRRPPRRRPHRRRRAERRARSRAGSCSGEDARASRRRSTASCCATCGR